MCQIVFDETITGETLPSAEQEHRVSIWLVPCFLCDLLFD
jgi:hypothetical protein